MSGRDWVMAEALEDVYRAGFEAGVKAYAYWGDGVQLVGTTGRTLSEAIEHVEETWNYAPPYGLFHAVIAKAEADS